MGLLLDAGIHWKCTVCGLKQEPVEGEEWPYHCGQTMKIQPWYRLLGNDVTPEEPT